MPGAIAVEGLTALRAGFRRVDSEVGPMLTAELQAAGDLVAESATAKGQQFYAPGAPAKARVTVARVYVQSTARTRRNSLSRKNFAQEQLEDSYEPALEENTPEIESRLELMLDRLIH